MIFAVNFQFKQFPMNLSPDFFFQASLFQLEIHCEDHISPSLQSLQVLLFGGFIFQVIIRQKASRDVVE